LLGFGNLAVDVPESSLRVFKTQKHRYGIASAVIFFG
jgi:hypothetical protein